MFGNGQYSARLFDRRNAVLGRLPDRHIGSGGGARRRTRLGASAAAVALIGGLLVTSAGSLGVQAAPVGQGFTVTASDLSYILDQIKIAEHHAGLASATDPCAGLLGTGPAQVPSPLVALGLRTVDGSCNNLQSGQEKFGTADQTFPRLTTADFRPAEADPGLFGPPGGSATSYAQTSGFVFDTQPRTISNLIVDQTSSNPAAVAAAEFPVRTQGNPGVVPCVTQPTTPGGTDGLPPRCVPAGETLFIPNVTTDVGLSPPYNSLFTIFGQFFDHGLDKITNGGNGSVVVPLNADDPLIVGPDGVAGTADDPVQCTAPNVPAGCDPKFVPVGQRFMALTRGTVVDGPGPDGVLGTADDTHHEALNTDSPWVDLSQAYTSHPSHQVFLREYALDGAGHPQSTGRLLGNADGSMANWGDVKVQTANLLGIQLVDTDVGNIPMIAADPYGNFIPGPSGFPQLVTGMGVDGVAGTSDDVLLEGNPGAPVATSTALRINTAFLNDIAHSAAPSGAPDVDLVAGTSLTPADCTGTTSPCYDNELLELHVIAGDGRANENIGLTSIHTIFEHEHNRLTVDEQNTLNANTTVLDDYRNTNCAFGCATNDVSRPTTFTYGERVFQAARFVTEMEYQHLVFEEFARKVQPAINPFNLFAFSSTATNPAIKAEFAHAVYRFGHSMLDETIPRTNVDGTTNDIALLDGFLNPAAFKDVTAGDLLASGGDMGGAGAGAIVMGLSDQVGNELDEFVSDTLRNNLLGLPLDLPSLNMTRARSEGIATLNNVRKQIFAETNDGQMTPYTDWVDFGLHIKHPESLINFVAAYGQHPTILAETTLIGKRNAARAIVNPDPLLGDVQPSDAADFMFSSGAWANTAAGVSLTGVDGIDLWVGGLAEITNLFGGLLGTTFNYVFELQLTQLQDDDRLYYLNRTPGMNLRAQLEGNSFAELVMRNTTATSLKADSFATADCKFQLGLITFPATAGTNISGGPNITGVGSVKDVPSTECDENALLIRATSGQIRYRPTNSVDPTGINGQSVYNGTAGVDLVAGGNDNDTFLGNEGDDVIEGNGGDDVSLGGTGNDIITDLAGFDTLKGGPGNDALDGGIGDDLLLGGDGKDLTAGGANTNVHFAGPGDDFIIAGQGADEVDGDSGDDWMQGGEQTDLLQGDSGSLFFDDHNKPGNDIMIGQAGDDDYDMEGGDDIGVAGPGIEKNAGAAGFDWSIGLGDPQPQDADLSLPVIGVPLPINQVRDRFNEVEALSGWNLDDTLHGDDIIPSQLNGGGFIGCDALDQAGLDRITGLDPLVPLLTVPSAPIIAASATNFCPLVGNVWGEGNILLGGAGSDTIEGRGADDIIDGDRYLSVRLSVRAAVDANGEATGPEIGTTDLLEHVPTGIGWTGALAGKTLQQAVFAGLVNPGRIVAVREVLSPATVPAADCGIAAPVNCDTALFSGPQSDYDISVTPATADALGGITVAHVGGTATDGIDMLRNIEQLSFCAIPGVVRGTCDVRSAPVLIGASAPAPAASVTTTPLALALAFGSVNTGVTTLAQTVTVANTGNAPLIVSGVTTTDAQFAVVANGCTTVAAGGSCTITVSFAPTATGAQAATLSIATNATGSPSGVALSGTGLAPVAAVSPATLTFGSVDTGTTTLPQVITIGNTGNATLTVSNVAVTGADAGSFTVTPTTCAPIAVGGTCLVSVSFAPTTSGTKAAAITVTHNSNNLAGSTSSVALSGIGLAPTAAVTPAALAFGSVTNGTVSTGQTITVSNTGNAPLAVTSVAVTGTNAANFTATPTGCASVAAGGSCTINVTFAPTTTGAKTATVGITHNGNNVAGTVSNVTLTGSGVAVTAPLLSMPVTLAFGAQKVNANKTVTLTVTNQGPGALVITSVNTSGAPFTATRGNCPATLAVGRNCKLNVTFRPTVVGLTSTGTLTVLSNASNSPTAATLTGSGR
jgi:Ca2+-binding RTX toxin-like protein